MEVIKNIKTYDEFENTFNGRVVDYSVKDGSVTAIYYDSGDLEICIDSATLRSNYFTSDELMEKLRIQERQLHESYNSKLFEYCCITAVITAVSIVSIAGMIFKIFPNY